MQKKSLLLAAAALVASASVAVAAVVFDAATGTGFVGKGDVQLAMGWNNAQLQANASSLVFTYTDEATYAQECQHETAKETRYKTFTRTRSVNSTVAWEARKNSQLQITGFFMNGYGDDLGGGGGEVGDDICPNSNDNGGQDWSPAEGSLPELVSASGGVLSVNGVPLQ